MLSVKIIKDDIAILLEAENKKKLDELIKKTIYGDENETETVVENDTKETTKEEESTENKENN
jgi:hypothetical protein